MATALEKELLQLLVETNEQRRRVGQVLYHFYRTLAFWLPKGRPFFDITKAWSAGAATIFDSLARTLAELPPPTPDPTLRAFLGAVLNRLADDLERGDHMLVPFLRYLETLFPQLTEMIREESGGSRIHDLELARELASLFAVHPDAERADFVRSLRASADGFLEPL